MIINLGKKHKRTSIGHRVYRIKYQGEPIENQFCGQIDHNKRIIKIQSGKDEVETLETFLHELIHGASDISGMKLSESKVMILGSLIAQALTTLK